jgi:ATP-binding cassette subfamily F protein 3
MLVFSHLALRRGNRLLLEEACFSIHPEQKVGITGANGTGKSSLFKLIMNELSVDSGSFTMPPNWVIAHVKQETPNTKITALQYTLQGDQEYTQLQAQIAQAEGEKLGLLHAKLEAINGYTAESRAAILLHGLGFTNDQIGLPVTQFSGGWRMRLNLAQALMCRSDLLLLDEPTNHLDLEAVIWLQDWLMSYKGTLLLISHDREFLDSIAGHIAHIESQHIALYTGNYSAFEKIRAEQLAQQQSSYDKQQLEVAHIQKYVDRFRAQATKAKQAQSRLKALQRMALIAPAHVQSAFQFRFKEPEKLPDRLLSLEEGVLGYGETVILTGVELELVAGARVGLIGPNGAGKSTLIKALAGDLALQSGQCEQAQYLKIGYFAQHQLDQLVPEQTPLEHLRQLDKQIREQELRSYLGGFGFQGERIDEAVAPFSGGEKARLVLALLVYQKPNLLLLDEPTNHLDLEMRHALTVALQGFVGAMVIVSHDRHLLKTVTDELIQVSHGQATPFDGDLDDYAIWLKQQNKLLLGKETSTKASKPTDRKQQRRQEAERRKQFQPMKNKLNKLERKMMVLSERQQYLQACLADVKLYKEENKVKLKQHLVEKHKVDNELDELEMGWLELGETYELALLGESASST